MKCKWEIKRIADIAYINPREKLSKGTLAKKVAMDKLQPFCRAIPEYELCEYSGGTKFRNGDTIMARITPCLENGKTAMVNILENNEIGFGSTEYIVFRARENLADANFLYYLVTSSLIREAAIKSMVGSSGRQRVQTDVLAELELPIPSLKEQRQISNILSTIDDKIYINNKINKNLSVLIQTIYQKRFTSKCQGILSDICMYSKERISVDDLTLDAYFSTENMLPNKAGVTTATSLPSTAQTTKCHIGDVLISNIRPYFKKILYCHREGGCSSDVLCFSPSSKKLSAFLYGVLYSDSFFDFMVAGSKGTKMPRGDKQQIMTYPIYVPTNDELDEYNAIAMPILDDIYRNTMENSNLSSLRDTLLPRLISSEVDVSSVEI